MARLSSSHAAYDFALSSRSGFGSVMPPALPIAGKRTISDSVWPTSEDPERAIESKRGYISLALGFQLAGIFEQIFARLRRF
ncbi:hypothetical protein MRA01_63830 [Methylobacterium radiotolerans]|nr:hypothetical protein MRA01_63830 [Methylobacterium radiotolerans]